MAAMQRPFCPAAHAPSQNGTKRCCKAKVSGRWCPSRHRHVAISVASAHSRTVGGFQRLCRSRQPLRDPLEHYRRSSPERPCSQISRYILCSDRPVATATSTELSGTSEPIQKYIRHLHLATNYRLTAPLHKHRTGQLPVMPITLSDHTPTVLARVMRAAGQHLLRVP